MPKRDHRHGRAHRASTLELWHLWCGVIVLVFLVLAAFSGSLLVYKKPLINFFIVQKTLSAHYDHQHIAAQLDLIVLQYEENKRDLIKAPNVEEPYWTLTGRDGQGIQLLSVDTLEPYQHNLWLLKFFSFIRALHTELFIGVLGEAVLLVSGVAALFLCVSGVVIWWPTKRSFRWRWVFPKSMSLRYLTHYHRHSGALSALILVVITLTGSIMLWQKLMGPLLPPVPVKQLPVSLNLAPLSSPTATSTTSASSLFLASVEQMPDAWPTYIRLPSTVSSDAVFRFRLPDEWHPNGRTSVKINVTNGTMTVSARSDSVNVTQRLINQLYPLHSAYGMHAVYVLLVFIGGIAMLWLSVTGGISYIRKRSAVHSKQVQ